MATKTNGNLLLANTVKNNRDYNYFDKIAFAARHLPSAVVAKMQFMRCRCVSRKAAATARGETERKWCQCKRRNYEN